MTDTTDWTKKTDTMAGTDVVPPAVYAEITPELLQQILDRLEALETQSAGTERVIRE